MTEQGGEVKKKPSDLSRRRFLGVATGVGAALLGGRIANAETPPIPTPTGTPNADATRRANIDIAVATELAGRIAADTTPAPPAPTEGPGGSIGHEPTPIPKDGQSTRSGGGFSLSSVPPEVVTVGGVAAVLAVASAADYFLNKGNVVNEVRRGARKGIKSFIVGLRGAPATFPVVDGNVNPDAGATIPTDISRTPREPVEPNITPDANQAVRRPPPPPRISRFE